MVITKITHTPVDLRRIFPGSWDQTVAEFLKEGIDLSSIDWKKKKDLRVLLSDLTIRVHLKDEGVLVYTFKRGWVTDLASVPRYLRSVVDNDARVIVIAALVHDSNFGCHWFTFTKSNRLFQKMIRKAGGSWWMGVKAFWGVQSPFGKMAYNRPEAEILRERKWSNMNWNAKA